MHEIRVEVVSPEEASFGTAELWVEDVLIAYTTYDDGDLMLRIEPSRDGRPVEIGVRGLADALVEVGRLPARY